jgi:hypothetical protein
MYLNPDIIYFTHSRIRGRFSGCGLTIEETYNQIVNKQIEISSIPKIKVFTDGSNYYSENNRRLYLFKKCKQSGLLQEIDVVVKPIKTQTNNQYSLNAKIAYK